MRMRDADPHFFIRRAKSLLGCVEQQTICIIHNTRMTSLGGLGFAQMSTRNGGANDELRNPAFGKHFLLVNTVV